MNANELADAMDTHGFRYHHVKKAVIMLRQQQAEIEALKAKTLTDEEIRAVWYEHPEFKDGLGVDPIPFAKAILKKASEK